MYIDERTYTLKNGKVPEFLKLYEAEGENVQIRVVGKYGWLFLHRKWAAEPGRPHVGS